MKKTLKARLSNISKGYKINKNSHQKFCSFVSLHSTVTDQGQRQRHCSKHYECQSYIPIFFEAFL